MALSTDPIGELLLSHPDRFAQCEYLLRCHSCLCVKRYRACQASSRRISCFLIIPRVSRQKC
jgi:hypothetical protein